MEFLDRSMLFSSVGQELRSRLESLAVEKRLKRQEVLFNQNDDDSALYVIDEGMIEISVVNADGRRLSLNVMRAGDVFGEIAMLDGGPRTASAVALRDSLLRCLQRRDVFEAMRSDVSLAFDLIQILAERLRWVSGLLEDQAFSPLPARVAKRLLLLDEQMAGGTATVSISQEELANFVGATREGVAKVLARWKRQGWIDVARGSLRIQDRSALENVARVLPL